jgi:hypothetical protein
LNLEDALELCAERCLLRDEVAALCSALDGSESRVLDDASATVARRYLAGELTFDVADTFMNSVWGYALNLPELPKLMDAIYMAFDDGEYHHPGDPDDVDSELKYTRPELERILAGDK